jgi:formate dehydrogenase
MAKKLNYKNSRQINIKYFEEIKKILSPLELRRDLLIEHLHLIQDSFGHISEDSLISLSTLLKLSMV